MPHSGELLGPDHVEVTLDHLSPTRIGHGVRSGEDPAVLQRVVDAGIALEVCPASNVSLGVFATLADVPLPTLVEAGATIALGADDPLLFGSRLVAQYGSARTDHGMDDAAVAALAASSVRASVAPDDVKKQLLAGVDEWLAT